MKVYLAGPMRGYANFNADAFRTAAVALRLQGHEVFSPVEYTESVYGPDVYKDNPDGDESKTAIVSDVVFLADLTYICKHADTIALLPGWRFSKGARAEHAVAVALGGRRVVEL